MYFNPSSHELLFFKIISFHSPESLLCHFTFPLLLLFVFQYNLFPLKCIREEVETLQNRKKQRLEEGARDKDKDTAEEKEKDDLILVVPFSKCLNTFFGDEIVEMRNPSLGPGILGPAKRTTSMGEWVKQKRA